MGAPVICGNNGGMCRCGGGGDRSAGSQELGQGEAGGKEGSTAGGEEGTTTWGCH